MAVMSVSYLRRTNPDTISSRFSADAAGRKAVPYAGPINYGWPKRHIRPRLFVNNGVASTESQWQKVYKDFIDKTLKQVKGK